MPDRAMLSGPCPCGSNRRYAVCCGALHGGARPARSAEALMRSRYSAYVLRLEAYLLGTWHPRTRPKALDLQGDAARWLGLQIHRTVLGGPQNQTGEVHFTARYRINRGDHQLTERSRFLRVEGAWRYLDGDAQPD